MSVDELIEAGPGEDGGHGELWRSAVEPLDPVAHGGWLVSGRESAGAAVRLVDCSPVTKLVIQAPPAGRLAEQLAVVVGRAELFEGGLLVACMAPGEWQVLCPTDADEFVGRFAVTIPDEPLGVVDLTHGRTLLRLTGEAAAAVLGPLTALDLSDRAFPLGTATTAALAGVRTGIVRDDLFADEAGMDDVAAPGTRPELGDDQEIRSYLLFCDRSAGRHLHEMLMEAGRSLGLAEEGYALYRARRADV